MKKNESNKINVVAIDDDISTLLLLQSFFKLKSDIKFMSFSESNSFLKYISSHTVDCVIIDRKLPVITGEALNILVKDINKNIYSILFTGDSPEFIKIDEKIYNFDTAYQKSTENVLDKIYNSIINNIKKNVDN